MTWFGDVERAGTAWMLMLTTCCIVIISIGLGVAKGLDVLPENVSWFIMLMPTIAWVAIWCIIFVAVAISWLVVQVAYWLIGLFKF